MVSKLAIVAAFALQTLLVFAGNSRLFGFLQPGSGWYTNVEMSQRYASLVTPAKWAFAIWGIIYTWEMVAVGFLWLGPTDGAFWRGARNPALWIAANGFQGVWALLFATERLTLAALALAGVSVSLIWLSYGMRSAGALEYWLVAAPFWLHAGWTTAASIVNFNLVVGLVSDVPTQLAVAHVSAFLACSVGLAIVFSSSADAASSSALIATPLVAALCWALAAICAELRHPFLITGSTAYAEIGEVGRSALQLVVGGSAVVLLTGAVVIVLARLISGRARLELK